MSIIGCPFLIYSDFDYAFSYIISILRWVFLLIQLFLLDFPATHVIFVQITGLAQSLTIWKLIRVFTFCGLLGPPIFVIAIEAHSFHYLGLVRMRTNVSSRRCWLRMRFLHLSYLIGYFVYYIFLLFFMLYSGAF